MAETKRRDLSHTPSFKIKTILGTGFFVVLCVIIAFSWVIDRYFLKPIETLR